MLPYQAYQQFHHVDVRRRRREQAWPGAPDHQRHAAARPREEHGVLDLVEAALESDPLAGEEPADDREGLLEPRDALVERDPEGAELGLVPAGAERRA